MRTWSDTVFLTRFTSADIPLFYVLSAVVFAPTTVGYSWLSKRIKPKRLTTISMFIFTVIAACCTQLMVLNIPPTIIFFILLIISLISPLVNAICWGLILETLNSRQSKRLIPLISSGSTIGAALGGVFAAELMEWGGEDGIHWLLWMIVICLTSLIPMPSIILKLGKSRIGKRTIQQGTTLERESMRDGLSSLLDNRLLRTAAIATFWGAVATNLVDYVLKVEVENALNSTEIGPFFARFHATTNIVILTAQLFFIGPMLQRLGVRSSYALYPVSLIIVSTICFGPIGLWAFVALRGVDTFMKFTVYSTTENLLLTPVPLKARTQSKVFLKGAVYPLGGLVAGLLVSIGFEGKGSLFLIIFTCIIWCRKTIQIHSNYLSQLSKNLKISLPPRSRGPFVKVGRDALKKEITSFNSNTTNEQRLSLPILLNYMGDAMGQPTLGVIVTKNLPSFTSRQRADLIEWLDLNMKREGIAGAGDYLEKKDYFNSDLAEDQRNNHGAS